MLDVETGPNRRISRSRKRASLTTQEHVKTTSSGGDGAENRTCSKATTKTSPVSVKVSPEKPSDWFCNSFDSRATRKRKSSHGETGEKGEAGVKRKVSQSSIDKKPLETSNIPPENMNIVGMPFHQSGIDTCRLSLEKENGSKQKMDELEDSMLSQTQDLDNTVDHDGKFVCANDSLAVIKVRKVSNDTLSQSQSQYFHTQLTEPMPSKFGNYKPTQKLTEKEVVIENKVTKCSSRVCTPFSFSFIGCDTQCDCDTSLNDSVSNAMEDASCINDSQNGAKVKAKQSDQIQQKRGVTSYSGQTGSKKISSSQLSSIDVFGESQTVTGRKLPNSKHISHYKIDYSQMTSQNSQSKQELVSGTQYHLGLQSQFQNTQNNNSQFLNMQNNSQIQSSSVFNQTGLIVDSQFNQTGAIVDSQDNGIGEISDDDIFEDSFNNSALLSQVDELDAKANETASHRSDSKGTVKDHDPDVTSHTQSLMGSCNQSGKTLHRKRRRRKSSFDNDISSIEQEMQRRRGESNNVSNSSGGDEALKENLEATRVCETNRKRVAGSDMSMMVNVKVNTELQGNDTKDLMVNTDKETSLVHDKAVNIGNTKDSHTSSVEKKSLTEPVTPTVGGTLQDRLRKKLQENAGHRTPQGPGSLVQQLREQVLERVQLETALLRARNQPVEDIGPFYGLPSKVKHLFETQRGIKTLYDWQDECLKLPAIAERKNLIYSLPTSGGKTLVAEILILQEIICSKKDALLVLPFVSIVQEKVRNLSQFAVDLDFLVEEYAGSKGRFPPTNRRMKNSLYIATIEKAHSIVNSLIENKRMDNLGLVIVDELHMIGEGGSRGATLESTLMKVLHCKASIQIIGMSATLNNIEDLQQFLTAEVYTNDFRPVQLTETIKLSDNIYSVNTKAKCPEDQFLHDRIVCFQYKPEMEKMDPDQLFGLVLEVIPDNSCLVFCPTKKNCENVAMMLAKMVVRYKRELSDVKKPERKALMKELYNDAAGKICPVLQYTLHFGIAYHHSGLTMDERKLIEEAYVEGTLCLLACTSTLAAGVNLPAKRVILRCPYVGQYFISRSQYKQMVGRAGRAGIDTSGESILICKTNDREKICDLLAGPLESCHSSLVYDGGKGIRNLMLSTIGLQICDLLAGPLESCHSSLVYDGGKGIRNLMLSTIGLQITETTEDVFTFMSRSLAKLQQSYLNIDIIDMCKDALQKLIDLGLVLQTRGQKDETDVFNLEVTQLGRATFKGPIDPDYAGLLYKDLKKAEEPLVVSTYLHLLYLVTPYDMVKDLNPSWLIYFTQVNNLSPGEMKVPALIGVPESYLARRASQQKSKLKVDEFVVNRFYLTLMLYDLWKQKTIWEVAEKFQQPRGFIQNLLSSAASFASCVAHFCQEMEEFWAYKDLMGNFVKRLSYCVTAELLPLMEIPGVKLGRAKLMYNAGFRTLSTIASADPEGLVRAVEHLPRKVAKQIVASAKLLLNEKAEAMMEEVEQLVSVPEGIATSSAAMVPTMDTPALVTPDSSQNSALSQH